RLAYVFQINVHVVIIHAVDSLATRAHCRVEFERLQELEVSIVLRAQATHDLQRRRLRMQGHQLERLEARRLIRRRQQLLQLLKLRRHVHKRRGKRSGVKSAYPAASDTHSRRDSVSPETRETQRALENLS